MSAIKDRELDEYRSLVEPPGYFEEGFSWRVLLGTVFIGLVMLPATMYMHLMIGEGIGDAAKWVTVILFLEMAKRARSFLRPAELLVLMTLIGVMAGQSPVEGFFWRQYLVQSDAARSFGMDNAFPDWFAPVEQDVLDQRNFFMWEWMLPLALIFLTQVVTKLDSLILGYGLFRVASDVEKLPFPMAPMQASGILALSEDTTAKHGWRWRCFSISNAMGLAFGLIYIGVPTISSTILPEPFQILPIPWLDTTTQTEQILPATGTGISFDLTNFFMGMALPFFAVVGTFIGLLVTVFANPWLYEAGILTTWKTGKSTLETMFANNVDFYLSFGIGLGVAVAFIGIGQIFSGIRKRRAKGGFDTVDVSKEIAPTVPEGVTAVTRGDIPNWGVILTYLVSSGFYILLAGWLLEWDFKGSNLLWVLLFFAVIYVPFISYVTARLEGMAGQVLTIPFVKEAAFIFSGYKGIEIWLLPLPLTANYGTDTVQYRVAELVGCSFRSKWKAIAVVTPVIFIASILYGQFIWSLGPIPSAQYPYAMEMWDFNARNQLLVYSSTSAGYSPFMDAFNVTYLAAGGVLGIVTYMVLGFFGLPIMLLYGTVKGLNQTMPQFVITQFAGAIVGRYIMARIFTPERWRQYALVLAAGFACGVGLIMMFATGIKFLSSAVYQLPY
jgi:hypothetical protein